MAMKKIDLLPDVVELFWMNGSCWARFRVDQSKFTGTLPQSFLIPTTYPAMPMLSEGDEEPVPVPALVFVQKLDRERGVLCFMEVGETEVMPGDPRLASLDGLQLIEIITSPEQAQVADAAAANDSAGDDDDEPIRQTNRRESCSWEVTERVGDQREERQRACGALATFQSTIEPKRFFCPLHAAKYSEAVAKGNRSDKDATPLRVRIESSEDGARCRVFNRTTGDEVFCQEVHWRMQAGGQAEAWLKLSPGESWLQADAEVREITLNERKECAELLLRFVDDPERRPRVTLDTAARRIVVVSMRAQKELMAWSYADLFDPKYEEASAQTIVNFVDGLVSSLLPDLATAVRNRAFGAIRPLIQESLPDLEEQRKKSEAQAEVEKQRRAAKGARP